MSGSFHLNCQEVYQLTIRKSTNQPSCNQPNRSSTDQVPQDLTVSTYQLCGASWLIICLHCPCLLVVQWLDICWQHTHICTHTHVLKCCKHYAHTHMHTPMYAYAHTHTLLHSLTCMHARMHAIMRTYAHTHTHTHTHTACIHTDIQALNDTSAHTVMKCRPDYSYMNIARHDLDTSLAFTWQERQKKVRWGTGTLYIIVTCTI